MRILRALVLAGMTFAPLGAHAVVRGQAVREPSGLRQSVVRIESSMGELCSGALIGPDLVLTAAHCIIDQAAYRIVAVDRNFRPRSFYAISAAVHPTFVAGTTPRTQPGIDLAILKLERPVGADFIALDPRTADPVGHGERVILAGYGVLSEGRRGSARVLRQTPLVSLGTLQVSNSVLVVADQDGMATRSGAGACRGDSGGPILQQTRRGYRLAGVVSWSSGAFNMRDSTACGGFTAVTPVADNLRWIVTGIDELNRFSAEIRSEWSRR